MTSRLDPHAREIMARVWPKYTATIPRDGEPVDVYRAERDAYVKEINNCDARIGDIELLEIPGPVSSIPLRIYRPAQSGPALLPVILYLHGGGWTVGGGDALEGTYKAYCAATGCLIVVPDYRLAPEHKFPAAVDDCWAAAKWLAEHAGEIGGDRERIAVAGESSGGNLAAVLSALAIEDDTVSFRTQCLVYPALDLRAGTQSYRNTEDVFTRDKMLWYIGCYIHSAGDAENPLASPVLSPCFAGLPPTVLVTGGSDPLLDEAEDYLTKLRSDGVPVAYLRLDGWPHGFAFWPETEAYQKMMAYTASALRKAVDLI